MSVESDLTVRRLDLHVCELDVGGGLDDDLDWLLPVHATDVALALQRAAPAVAFIGDGGFEGEVVGSNDVDSGHAVVVYLQERTVEYL